MDKTEKKYPVEKAKGVSTKYTKLWELCELERYTYPTTILRILVKIESQA
jgi:hypothetical protein